MKIFRLIAVSLIALSLTACAGVDTEDSTMPPAAAAEESQAEAVELAPVPNISFEADEDLSFVQAYKEGELEFVSEGVTDGERALHITVGKLDTDYSGIIIKKEEGNWGWPEGAVLKMDGTNPHDEEIQIRMNIKDSAGRIRTVYYYMEPNATRTLVVETIGALKMNVTDKDGWWGAENYGLDPEIKSLELYLWEDKPDATVNSFILDNMRLELAE